MNTLKDFIKKTYSINDNFNIPKNILEYHFFIEFNIRDRQNFTINEKYGKYDGQLDFILELANVLYSDVVNNYGQTIEYNIERGDLDKMFDNIFFNSITIKYTDNVLTGYNSNVIFNSVDKKIENISININSNDYKTHDDLITVLVHELTHAWEDYNRYLQNKNNLSDIIKQTNYNKVKINSKNIDISNFCKTLLYRLKRFERNAYISEFAATLDKQNELIISYKDAVKLFTESEIWTDIQTLKDTFEYVYNTDDFINTYNKLNNTNYTSQKIYKKISKQIKEYISKLETLMPKLYYEYYEKHKIIPESVLTHYGNKFIKTVEISQEKMQFKIKPYKKFYNFEFL